MEQSEGLETVEHLIQTTGLSVEDLLQQLQKYKALKHTTQPCTQPSDDSLIPTSSTNDEDSFDSFLEITNSTKNLESTGVVAKNETDIITKINDEISDVLSSEISSTTEPNPEKCVEDDDHVLKDEATTAKEKNECIRFPKLQVKSFAKEEETVVKDHYNSLMHKALLMDHDYDKSGGHSDSEPEEPPDPVDSTSVLENVRDNLRLQLSFLRTKKKDDLPVSQTTEAALPFNANLKRKRKSEELERPYIPDDIISLSDETEFMIVDVTGGVDRVVEDDCEKLPKSEEDEKVDEKMDGEKKHEGEKKVDEKEKNEDKNEKIEDNDEKKQFEVWRKKDECDIIKDQYNKKVDNDEDDDKKKDENEKEEDEHEKRQDEEKKLEEKNGIIETILSIRKRKRRDLNESVKKAKLESIVDSSATAQEKQKSDNLDGKSTDMIVDSPSPFVSNKLDEFLNENLKLNVSYPLPKLGAEDGIKNTPSPFDHMETEARNGLLQQQRVAYKRKHNIKAKTLAEMRRQMGLTKRKETIKRETVKPKASTEEIYAYKVVQAAIKEEVKQEIKENEAEQKEVINPAALKQETYKAAQVVKQENEESVGDKIVLTVPRRRSSFVMYGKRMLWLPSYTSEKCIGKVDVFQECPKPKNESLRTEPSKVSKPTHVSILSPVLKTPVSKLSKYKAGPLCKKRELLRDDEWTVEMKKMPQVYLEVLPEIGKPISQEIEHFLPLHENIVSEARATFALSALRTQESNRTIFKMIVPYEDNRHEVLVRKKKVRYDFAVSETAHDCDPSVTVKSVLDALLDFVERKEDIDNIVEKYDDEAVDSEMTKISEESEMPKGDKNSPEEKRRRKRRTVRSRIDTELLRLNCKIIDVQENLEEHTCQKPSCRLGCVCKSLACDGVFSAHCQLVECMFNCTCPLPVNLSDTLSTYTLNHLDGEAKKNLAKVEREFTQTIIHAGNDTIVMGAGGRNKARRSCKQPKKYSDFVQTNLITSYKEDETWNLLQDKFQLKKCTVDVPTLELDNAVPLCIVHGKYCCWCNGTVPSVSKKKKPLPEKMETKPLKQEGKPSKTEIKPSIQIPLQNQELIESPPVKKSTSPATSVTPVPTVATFSNESCARLREVSSAYRFRNKTITHFKQIVEFVDDKIFKIINDDDKSQNKPNKHNKRKQSFAVREDVDDANQYEQMQKVIIKEKKFRRNKIPLSLQEVENEEMDTEKVKDEKIFDEEIKIPLSNNINAEMVQIIGEENPELSLLPWPALMRNFKSGLWTIWCLKSDPKKMICTKKGFEPPNRHDFVNIYTGLYSTPVIEWILADKLPDNKPVDRVHFLLAKLDENNFEVKGVCMKNNVDIPRTAEVPGKMEITTKKVQKRTKKESISCKRKKDDTDESSEVLTEESTEILEEESAEERTMPTLERMDILPRPQNALKKLTLPSNRSLKCSHKNINGETKCLSLLNRPFDLRPIRSLDGCDTALAFDVPLPRIGVASKWLLVYLNSDFSYLNFTASQYSIKYNDLMDVVTMAKNLQKTIILRNNEFTKTYINISFGIFCVPTFQDRLFVGPFARTEEPNVETLRFMHGSLVNTYLFNQMRGRVDAKNSVFMEEVEVPRKSTSSSKSPKIALTDVPTSKPAKSPKITLTDVPTSKPAKSPKIALTDVPTSKPAKFPKIALTDVPTSKPATISRPLMDFPQRRICKIRTESKLVPSNIPLAASKFDQTFFFSVPFITAIMNIVHDKQKPNRIVVTNIPHFGHFLAYQNVKHFDLYWPDGRTAYRFKSALMAKETLKCYLHNVLCTIPESFKIDIVIMTTVNDPKSEVCRYLDTHRQWIVGDFGICQLDRPSEDILKTYEINELTSRAACPRRQEENVSMIIRLFGLLFLGEECVSADQTIEQILYKVQDKISKIEDTDGIAGVERSDLVRTIQLSKAKLRRFNNVGSLLIGTSKQETSKLYTKQETASTSTKIIPETIEIPDSDDEDISSENKPAAITKLTVPAFKRIVQSGKIQQGTPTATPTSTGTSLLKTAKRIFAKPSAGLVSLLKNSEVKVMTTSGVPLKLMVKDSDNAKSSQNSEATTKIVVNKTE